MFSNMRFFIPSHFKCPITQKIMRYPVVASDGFTYEQEAIKAWSTAHGNSFMTQQFLLSLDVVSDTALKKQIDELLEAHPEINKSNEVYLPEQWIKALVQAISSNSILDFYKVISRDQRLIIHKFKNDYTTFHYACEFGSLAITLAVTDCLGEAIIAIAALEIPRHWQPKHLNALLIDAFLTKEPAIVAALLTLGANPNYLNISNFSNETYYKELSRWPLLAVDLNVKDISILGKENQTDKNLHVIQAVIKQQMAMSNYNIQPLLNIYNLFIQQQSLISKENKRFSELVDKNRCLEQEIAYLKQKIEPLEIEGSAKKPEQALSHKLGKIGLFKSEHKETSNLLQTQPIQSTSDLRL